MVTVSDTAIARKPFDDLVLEDRVHRLIYTDPEIFELEMERIFASTWLFVGHESEVAQPGDYKTTTIVRRPVILTRDEDEQVRVLYNRCRHRGAVVCREERGNSKYFRCLYHGWTYGSDGCLIGVPYRPGYGDQFDTDVLGLVSVPNVASYRGFVFLCFKPEVEPLEASLGRARRYIDSAVDQSPEGEIEVARHVQKHSYRANWKLHLENFVDSYHPSFAHEATFARREYRSGKPAGRGDVGSENVDLGHGHAIVDYTAAAGDLRSDRYGVNLAVFPNLLLCTPHRDLRVISPISVDYTQTSTYHYRLKGADQEVNRRAVKTTTTAIGASGMVEPEDFEAYERIQEGLQAEGVDWALFSRGLHREWVTPSGELRGAGADELGNRGQHREYRRLMLQDTRRCCSVAGACLGPRAEAGRS